MIIEAAKMLGWFSITRQPVHKYAGCTRLTKHAEGRGKGHEITEKLFHEYLMK